MDSTNYQLSPNRLTPKQETFCLAVASGKTQSDAYRMAFNVRTKRRETVWVNASKLMADAKVLQRVEELRAAIENHCTMTRAEFERILEAQVRFDPRKLFDQHNNCRDIPDLEFNEAMGLAGFEILEEFEGKGKDRKAIGYTKKFKHGDRTKAADLLGKTRGWIKSDLSENHGPVTIVVQNYTVQAPKEEPLTIGRESDN